MTSLSQYLAAEEPDRSEPASFYVPGAVDWSWGNTDALMLKMRSVDPAEIDRLYPSPEFWEDEFEG